MELCEMTDADKVMNPQHFGRDPADIRIRIGIPDHFWLKFWHWQRFLLSEYTQSCGIRVTSDWCHQLATVRCRCVYCTWQLNHFQQVAKNSDFCLPHLHSALVLGVGGSCWNIDITFGME